MLDLPGEINLGTITIPGLPTSATINDLPHQRNNITSIGKEFYLGFMQGFDNNGNKPTVIISALNENAVVKLSNVMENTTVTYSINSMTSIEIVLQNNLVTTTNGYTNKTIHLQSDHDITVSGLHTAHRSSDGYLALPVESFGHEYVLAMYKPSFRAEFLIFARNDNTQVNISFSKPTVYQQQTYSRSTLLTIQLNRSTGFFFKSANDLSGTIIKSSSEVAVYSGNRCTYVSNNTPFCDHLVEQMIPVPYLGYNYILHTFVNRSAGDLFRVVAPHDDIDVFVHLNTRHYHLSKGSFVEFEIASNYSTLLTCSLPCLLVQFNKGGTADGISTDPFMTIVPAVEQFLPFYNFYIPSRINFGGILHHYINIVIEKNYRNGLILDGTLLTDISWEVISIYVTATIEVGNGSHYLNHSVSGVDFSLTIYGYGVFESYGLPGGIRLSPLPHGRFPN